MLCFSSIRPGDIKSTGSVSSKASGDWTPVSKAYCSNTFVKLLRGKKRESASAVSSPAPLRSTPGKDTSATFGFRLDIKNENCHRKWRASP